MRTFPICLFLIAVAGFVSESYAQPNGPGTGGPGGGGGGAAATFHGHYFTYISIENIGPNHLVREIKTHAGNQDAVNWIADAYHEAADGTRKSLAGALFPGGGVMAFPQTVPGATEKEFDIRDISTHVVTHPAGTQPELLVANFKKPAGGGFPGVEIPDVFDAKISGVKPWVSLPVPFDMTDILPTSASGFPAFENFQIRVRVDAPNGVSRGDTPVGFLFTLVCRVFNEDPGGDWETVFHGFEMQNNFLTLSTSEITLEKEWSNDGDYDVQILIMESVDGGANWLDAGWPKAEFKLTKGAGK